MQYDKERLEALKKAVLLRAKSDRDKILQNAHEKEQAILQDIKDKAVLRAQNEIQNELRKIEAKAKAKINDTRFEAKKRVLMLRQQIQKNVRDRLVLKLKEFTKSDRYKDYLLKNIKGIDAGGPLTVKVGPAPLDKAVAAECFKGADIIEDNSIKIGGIKVIDLKDSLVYDITLDSKVDAQMQNFLSVAALTTNV